MDWTKMIKKRTNVQARFIPNDFFLGIVGKCTKEHCIL